MKSPAATPDASTRQPNSSTGSHRARPGPASGSAPESALWQRLRESNSNKRVDYLRDDSIGNNSGTPCPARSAIAVNMEGEAVPIHANRITFDHDASTASAAPAAPLAPLAPLTNNKPRTAIAAQSPQTFALCERFLIQGLDSGQGLFQFVSRKAHAVSSGCRGTSREVPIIAQLFAEMASCKKQDRSLQLGGRYEVIKLDPAAGDQDHHRATLTVRDPKNDGKIITVPLTQAGLRFTDRVLGVEHIEQANALMDAHKTSLQPEECATSQPTDDPLIASFAGIGRNATLISYREVRARLDALPAETRCDEQWLDNTLLDVISTGRRDRGNRFIHSDAQLQELRKALVTCVQGHNERIPPARPSAPREARERARVSNVLAKPSPTQLPVGRSAAVSINDPLPEAATLPPPPADTPQFVAESISKFAAPVEVTQIAQLQRDPPAQPSAPYEESEPAHVSIGCANRPPIRHSAVGSAVLSIEIPLPETATTTPQIGTNQHVPVSISIGAAPTNSTQISAPQLSPPMQSSALPEGNEPVHVSRELAKSPPRTPSAGNAAGSPVQLASDPVQRETPTETRQRESASQGEAVSLGTSTHRRKPLRVLLKLRPKLLKRTEKKPVNWNRGSVEEKRQAIFVKERVDPHELRWFSDYALSQHLDDLSATQSQVLPKEKGGLDRCLGILAAHLNKSHYFQEISGYYNNCWLYSSWLSVMARTSPHELEERLLNCVQQPSSEIVRTEIKDVIKRAQEYTHRKAEFMHGEMGTGTPTEALGNHHARLGNLEDEKLFRALQLKIVAANSRTDLVLFEELVGLQKDGVPATSDLPINLHRALGLPVLVIQTGARMSSKKPGKINYSGEISVAAPHGSPLARELVEWEKAITQPDRLDDRIAFLMEQFRDIPIFYLYSGHYSLYMPNESRTPLK